MPRIASLVLICCVSLMSTLLLRDMEELDFGKGVVRKASCTLSDIDPRSD